MSFRASFFASCRTVSASLRLFERTALFSARILSTSSLSDPRSPMRSRFRRSVSASLCSSSSLFCMSSESSLSTRTPDSFIRPRASLISCGGMPSLAAISKACDWPISPMTSLYVGL